MSRASFWTRLGGGDPARAGARVILVAFVAFAVAIFGWPTAGLQLARRDQAFGAISLAWVNPSSFGETIDKKVIVSDMDTGSDSTYRLSVWASDPPAGSGVEFELRTTGSTLAVDTIGVGSPVGDDTWEYQWDIPSTLPDGNYALRATMFFANEEVTHVDKEVRILRTAERAELSYPDSGGPLASYRPLANSIPDPGQPEATRGRPISVYEGESACNTCDHLEAFYTTTAPGQDPEWISCGTTTGGFLARCTFLEGDDQTAVTGSAVVLYNSQTAGEEPDSGDATRAIGYAQNVTRISVTNTTSRTDRNANTGAFGCSATATLTVFDQLNRGIPGANIDVTAQSPGDKLFFDTGFTNVSGIGGVSTAPFGVKVPDRDNHSPELGYNCTSNQQSTNSAANQGEHNVFGGADRKHIEASTGGTGNTGTWGFRMKNLDNEGATQWTIWVDEGDDGTHANSDTFVEGAGELGCNGSIGWGQDAPAPTGPNVGAASAPCQGQAGATPTPTTSSSPSPTASSSPTGPPPPPPSGARSVSLQSNKRKVGRGGTITFTGAIASDESVCRSGELIKLKARRPGRTFRTIRLLETDDDGNYRARVRQKHTREYRAVVPASGFCEKARSATVRVRTPA